MIFILLLVGASFILGIALSDPNDPYGDESWKRQRYERRKRYNMRRGYEQKRYRR